MQETAPHTRSFAGGVRRAGLVRLFVFFLVLFLAYAGPQILLQLQILPHAAKDLREVILLAHAAITAMLGLGVYGLLVAVFERRHAIELNPGRGLPLAAAGLGLAILMFCVVYAVLFALRAAAWHGFAGTAWLAAMAGLAIASGVCEELIFRGGIYRITEDMFGTGAALVISGALFGLLHLANPHASLLAGIAIALEAGILLGAAYAATRSLWFPIGIHIGWNFAEGGVFGAPVSGSPAGRGLFDLPLSGPEWLTGGAFGPEASLVTVAICTLAGLYFVVRTIRSGRWCRVGFRLMLD